MNNHTVIIAEAGVNHNADINLARRMIVAAKEAGADYVKFQTAVPELVISSVAPKAEYQKASTGNEESQLEMCRKLHFPVETYRELKEFCAEVGIGFSSTPFDMVSLRFLIDLGVDFIKIPSGEITNLPMLEVIRDAAIPVILSSGMSTFAEVERTVRFLSTPGREGKCVPAEKITVLQCNTQYPTPYGDVNLRAMAPMGEKLGVKYGYSDHTPGTEVAVGAVALGASVIEKHFTLDRNLPGPDQSASLEPDELKSMIEQIRNIELALGSELKTVSPSEKGNMEIARKSIVAARHIRKGELFTEENLAIKRPGNGISPWEYYNVIGKTARKDFPYDALIEL